MRTRRVLSLFVSSSAVLPFVSICSCVVFASDNKKCNIANESSSSCQAAAPVKEEDDGECVDFHSNCQVWATQGECLLNPAYMARSCQKSCWVCIDEKQLRREEMDEETIRQRKAYVNANFGVLQKVSDNEKVKSDTAQILKDMDVYARTVVFSGKLDPVSIAACKNKHEFCAHWAMRGECEVNLNYHMFNCPLACRMCEHHLEYLRCGGVIQSNEDGDGDMYDDPPTIEADGGMMRLFASMQQHKEYIVDTLVGPAATTANNTMKNQDDPWVLNVENFLNKQECDDLIELANEIGWTPSPRTGGDEHPGVLQHDKPRRTTQSAICGSNSNNNRKACELHPTYQKVLQRIADFLATEGGDAPTGIAAGWMLSHVEQPLEFVKYESTNNGESFSSFSSHGVHHDFSWIDAWKQAGPRVLSLFLTLGVSEKEGSKNVTAFMQGGALGFPDLDWLSIPPIKGQAIIWPNVLGSDLNKMNDVMVSEGLPVWEGTKYGVHVWIRMHDYEASRQRGCA